MTAISHSETIETGAIATLIQALSHHPSVRNTAVEFDEGDKGTNQFKIQNFSPAQELPTQELPCSRAPYSPAQELPCSLISPCRKEF